MGPLSGLLKFSWNFLVMLCFLSFLPFYVCCLGLEIISGPQKKCSLFYEKFHCNIIWPYCHIFFYFVIVNHPMTPLQENTGSTTGCSSFCIPQLTLILWFCIIFDISFATNLIYEDKKTCLLLIAYFRMEVYRSSSLTMTRQKLEEVFLDLHQCNVHCLILRWKWNK